MIQFRHVVKDFENQSALQGIDLTIATGSTHVILGPSGCGKSTLARLAAGILTPTRGEVLVQGLNLWAQPLAKRAQLVGFMNQEGGLFPHLTCEQNVLLPLQIHAVPRPADRCAELCALVGLSSEMLRRFPRQVSGGQRQRVSLMRALALDPSIIILDEPMGALDPIVRRDLQVQLKAIFSELKKTVLFVTHDIAEAAFLADTVTLMNDGQIVQTGTLCDLIREPRDAFVAKFMAAQKPPLELTLWDQRGGQ